MKMLIVFFTMLETFINQYYKNVTAWLQQERLFHFAVLRYILFLKILHF